MKAITMNELAMVAGGAVSEPSKPWEDGCFPQPEDFMK